MADELPKPNRPASKRWEFRHPVLKMMGLPRIYLPSNKWLAFWAVTGSIIAAGTWDRRERRRVRERWKETVKPWAEIPITADELPRKLRVFLAPPPNDFLDSGLQEWRRYIKPILTAAAVDYDLVVEEGHQGHIRTVVAEEIRDRRRKAEGLPLVLPQKNKDEIDKLVEAGITRDSTGGVLIVGRGAYKEYMAGLHEGYLGPLEMPPEVATKEAERKANLEKKKESSGEADAPVSSSGEVQVAEINDAAALEDSQVKATAEDNDTEAKKEPESKYETDEEASDRRKRELAEKYPVTPAFISVYDYQSLPASPLLQTDHQEALSVFRMPHLLGFLSFPVRIFRWFNQRYLAEELCSQTAGVVAAHTRALDAEADASLAESDEKDWPNRFKREGLERNSEWMKELKIDPRVAEHLRIYTQWVPLESPEEELN